MSAIVAPAGIRVSLDIYLTCDEENELGVANTVMSLCKMKGCPAIDTPEGLEKITKHSIDSVAAIMPGNWRLMTDDEVAAYIEENRDDD